LEPGRPTPFTFPILDQSGQPVTSFVEQHERAMHLIVVRRDLFGFRHLHPIRRADGTWMAEMTLPTAGVWRAFADFATDRGTATLGVDLFAGGRFDPMDLPAPDSTATAEGYQVAIQPRERAAGQRSELIFQAVHKGQPVADLEPYLAPVATWSRCARRSRLPARSPTDAATPDASIGFSAALPTAGCYRLSLQFQHDGSGAHGRLHAGGVGDQDRHLGHP